MSTLIGFEETRSGRVPGLDARGKNHSSTKGDSPSRLQLVIGHHSREEWQTLHDDCLISGTGHP